MYVINNVVSTIIRVLYMQAAGIPRGGVSGILRGAYMQPTIAPPEASLKPTPVTQTPPTEVVPRHTRGLPDAPQSLPEAFQKPQRGLPAAFRRRWIGIRDDWGVKGSKILKNK